MMNATPIFEPLSVSSNRLNTISALRDTVGSLEAEFTQFNIICSGDIQQLKDKIVKQDNLLKVQRKTIDDIAVDLSSQVKCLSDELKQQSVLIKKIQEENQSLHKKNAKLSETNVDLLGKQGQLEKEVAFLKEQVEALWRKPLVELTDTPKPQIKPDQECRQNITEEFIESQESKFTDEDLLLVNLPTQNRFAILQDSDTQKKEVEIDSLPNAKDNPSSIKTNGNSILTNYLHLLPMQIMLCFCATLMENS